MESQGRQAAMLKHLVTNASKSKTRKLRELIAHGLMVKTDFALSFEARS